MYYKGAAAAIVVSLESLFWLPNFFFLSIFQAIRPSWWEVICGCEGGDISSWGRRLRHISAFYHTEFTALPPPPPLLDLPLILLSSSTFFLFPDKVYDFTKRKTFETLQQWISELRAQGPENIVLAIAGNKCDLEDERQVRVCM